MRRASLVLVAVFFAIAGPPQSARAVDLNDATTSVSLADRLKTGLRARRPQDTDFLERVAHLVDTGMLPRKLVDSTYMWAIRRRQDYPLPAFERAIHLQADRLGVPLTGELGR